jgi:hypothetical protein
VIEKLRENALKALKQKNGSAVANRALELIGKQLGMFIERREDGKPGDFSHLSDEELDAQLTQRLKARGLTDKQIRSFLVAPHPVPATSQEAAAGTLMLARRRISFS